MRTSLTRRTPNYPTIADEAFSRFFGPRFFDDLLTRSPLTSWGDWSTGQFMPAVDLRHTDSGYSLEVDLPGLSKDDVDISVEDNVLTLSGERTWETPEGEEYERHERWTGKFSRSFALPSQVDPEGVKAKFENGVLTIELPKAAEARRRRIEIH